MNNIVVTPSVNAMADVNAPVAASPAAKLTAVSTVKAANAAGTAGRASEAPRGTMTGASPRRVNRSRNRPRPLASLLLTVPGGQPSCRAAYS
jgi:hypothetical protein